MYDLSIDALERGEVGDWLLKEDFLAVDLTGDTSSLNSYYFYWCC
jgi:hypothetical protein